MSERRLEEDLTACRSSWTSSSENDMVNWRGVWNSGFGGFSDIKCIIVASARSDAIPHGVRPGCGTRSEGVIHTFCRGREILLLEYYRTGSSNPNLRKN